MANSVTLHPAHADLDSIIVTEESIKRRIRKLGTDVAAAYAAIEAWFATSGHRPTGAPWDTYLYGPEVPQPRTTVTWPCSLD